MVLPGEEMDSVSELLYSEDLINEFTNSLLWTHECEDLSHLRKAWTLALKEGRMDERLALRVLQERIHEYTKYEADVMKRKDAADKKRKSNRTRAGYFKRKDAPDIDTHLDSQRSDVDDEDSDEISECESGVKGDVRDDSHDQCELTDEEYTY